MTEAPSPEAMSVCPPATATPITNPGSILFSRKDQIFVMYADGTEVRQLTDGSSGAYRPDWSPDGNEFIFESRREDRYDTGGIGNQHLFVMDVDGFVGQLTGINEDWEFDPSWSPDGSQIAFVRLGGIFVMNADISGLRQLTNTLNDDRDSNPVWSPDGRRIAFIRDSGDPDGGAEILVLNLDGTSLRRLFKSDGALRYLAWSPKGNKIAFIQQWYRVEEASSAQSIFVINTDGTGLEQLTDNEDSEHGLAWSPDAEKIAFSRVWWNGGIQVMNADGTNVVATGIDGVPHSWTCSESFIKAIRSFIKTT